MDKWWGFRFRRLVSIYCSKLGVYFRGWFIRVLLPWVWRWMHTWATSLWLWSKTLQVHFAIYSSFWQSLQLPVHYTPNNWSFSTSGPKKWWNAADHFRTKLCCWDALLREWHKHLRPCKYHGSRHYHLHYSGVDRKWNHGRWYFRSLQHWRLISDLQYYWIYLFWYASDRPKVTFQIHSLYMASSQRREGPIKTPQ